VWDGSAARFAHDALAPILLESMPLPIRRHLHARVAGLLAERGADPARIARHWISAGRGDLAAPCVLASAERAFALSRQIEATRLWEEAATLFEGAGRLTEAHAALVEGGRRVRRVNSGVAMPRFIASLERVERTDRERSRTLLVRAWWEQGGDERASEALARRALEMGLAHGDVLVEAEARQMIFLSLNRRGDIEASIPALAEFREAAARLGEHESIIAGYLHEGELEAARGRHARAAQAVLEGYEQVVRWERHRNHLSGFLGAAAFFEIARGHVALAEALLERAAVHVGELESMGLTPHPRYTHPRIACDFVRGRLAQSFAALRTILEREKRATWLAQARVLFVRVATRIGSDALAERELDALLASERATDRERAEAVVARADVAVGIRPSPSRAHAKMIERSGSPLDRVLLRLSRRTQAEASRALAEAEELGADAHAALARCVLGEIALDRGDARRALDLSRCEYAGFEIHPPRFLALEARARARLGERKKADAAMAAALASVEAMSQGLPPRERDRFVATNKKHFGLIRR
jgi:hypothetical protein